MSFSAGVILPLKEVWEHLFGELPLLVLTHLDAQLCPAPWLPLRQLSADSLESIRE